MHPLLLERDCTSKECWCATLAQNSAIVEVQQEIRSILQMAGYFQTVTIQCKLRGVRLGYKVSVCAYRVYILDGWLRARTLAYTSHRRTIDFPPFVVISTGAWTYASEVSVFSQFSCFISEKRKKNTAKVWCVCVLTVLCSFLCLYGFVDIRMNFIVISK